MSKVYRFRWDVWPSGVLGSSGLKGVRKVATGSGFCGFSVQR